MGKSMCMFQNSTAILQTISVNYCNFVRTFEKRAFAHSYVQYGMEETEMLDAKNEVQALYDSYNLIHSENSDSEDHHDPNDEDLNAIYETNSPIKDTKDIS